MQLKQDCPEEDTQLTTLHDVVIASLRHQLDEMQQTLDFLRASDQSLRLALRVSDMRVQETEVELSKAIERYYITISSVCSNTTWSYWEIFWYTLVVRSKSHQPSLFRAATHYFKALLKSIWTRIACVNCLYCCHILYL